MSSPCVIGSGAGSTAQDRYYMKRALVLARRSGRAVRPNPNVGALVVGGGKVLGAGWHERAGEAHAEVIALKAAGSKARGATLYVTLEPCNHHGRTPPCTDAILEAGVAKVVFALEDSNPRVAGCGAARLQEAGVEITGGVLRGVAEKLVRPWLAWIAGGEVLEERVQVSEELLYGNASVDRSKCLRWAQKHIRPYVDAVLLPDKKSGTTVRELAELLAGIDIPVLRESEWSRNVQANGTASFQRVLRISAGGDTANKSERRCLAELLNTPA